MAISAHWRRQPGVIVDDFGVFEGDECAKVGDRLRFIADEGRRLAYDYAKVAD